MGQWVGSGQMTKNLINPDLIKIIQFFLKIYDFPPWGGGGCGWLGESMGGVKSND